MAEISLVNDFILKKQAGRELCIAQVKLGLAKPALAT